MIWTPTQKDLGYGEVVNPIVILLGRMRLMGYMFDVLMLDP